MEFFSELIIKGMILYLLKRQKICWEKNIWLIYIWKIFDSFSNQKHEKSTVGILHFNGSPN